MAFSQFGGSASAQASRGLIDSYTVDRPLPSSSVVRVVGSGRGEPSIPRRRTAPGSRAVAQQRTTGRMPPVPAADPVASSTDVERLVPRSVIGRTYARTYIQRMMRAPI